VGKSIKVFLALICVSLHAPVCSPSHKEDLSKPYRYHIVAKGETLFSIAKRYGISLQRLREANNRLDTDVIRVGEKLLIPLPEGSPQRTPKTLTSRQPKTPPPEKPRTQPSSMQPKRIEVIVGKSVIVRAKRILSVHISNPMVADVVVMSQDVLAVVGKSRGSTTLIILDEVGVSTYDVTVKEQVQVSAERVATAIGIPGILVQVVDSAIVLSGKVATREQKEIALKVAKLFSENVIDLISVEEVERKPEEIEKPKKPSLQPSELEQLIGIESVRVRSVGEMLVVEGEVETQAEMERVQQVAQVAGTTVLNLVRVRLPSPDEVKGLLGIPTVDVKLIHDCYVFTGEVKSEEERKAIDELASLLGKKVLNLVRVSKPLEVKQPEPKPPPKEAPPEEVKTKTLPERLKELIGIDTVDVIELSGEKVMLKGSVKTSVERERVLKIAEAMVGKENVVDMLQVMQPLQLRVEAWVVEINREALRQLGVQHPESVVFGEVGDATTGRVFTRLTNIQSILQMLISKNVAKVLSAPSAVAASGKQAKFTVGGEIPIPVTMLGGPAAGVQTSLGTGVLAQAIEFRQYGIILTVTGTIEHDGLIKLKLQTEVSAPAPGVAVTIGGATIPGFRTRSYETELELKPGEGVVLAGLISSEDVQYWRRVPILSSIPVLGELFKSRRFERRETELAIFVTPTVVSSEQAQNEGAKE
jgi:pilus assembly protein CpaC